MADSAVIGVGVFSLELDQFFSICCRFPRVRRERKKEFGHSKRSDFEEYIQVITRAIFVRTGKHIVCSGYEAFDSFSGKVNKT